MLLCHGNAQPDKQPEHTGFLKEYGRILLSAALLFSGIIMKATEVWDFHADDNYILLVPAANIACKACPY